MIRDDPKLNFKDSGYNRAMPISNINDDCYNAAILFSVVLQLELVYLRRCLQTGLSPSVLLRGSILSDALPHPLFSTL
jgi:hypothetical protein